MYEMLLQSFRSILCFDFTEFFNSLIEIDPFDINKNNPPDTFFIAANELLNENQSKIMNKSNASDFNHPTAYFLSQGEIN